MTLSAVPKKKRTVNPPGISAFKVSTATKICALITEGWSLRQICDRDGMPHRATVLRWISERADFKTQYANARQLQADALEEEMSDIEDMTLVGELDAKAAAVVLRSKQWRASKLAPKKYGERLELGGTLDVNNKIERITRRIVDTGKDDGTRS